MGAHPHRRTDELARARRRSTFGGVNTPTARTGALAVFLSVVWLTCLSCGDRPRSEATPATTPEARETPVVSTVSDTPLAPPAPLGPRWVHRFVPKGLAKYQPEEDRWRPEGPRIRESTPGMVVWEVSEISPGTLPTAAQQRTADDFVERCFEAAVRHGWDRFERALSDGYRSVDRHHYRNDEYMLDDRVLDPDHPEVLMFYTTPPVGTETEGRQRLAGFMFYAKNREARGPQFGGPLTIWHYHSWFRPQCVVDGLAVNWSIDGKCKRGSLSYFSGEMVHVWLIDRKEGRFATPMFIPRHKLEPMLAQRLEERGF
jgi:hypothetical protein